MSLQLLVFVNEVKVKQRYAKKNHNDSSDSSVTLFSKLSKRASQNLSCLFYFVVFFVVLRCHRNIGLLRREWLHYRKVTCQS